MKTRKPKSKPVDPIAPAVIEQIRAMMDEFTKSQRMLAEYIVQRPEKIGYLPINALAAAAGISVATVIRFCNKLGYSGYIELGREVQNSIQTELSTIGRFNLARSTAGLKDRASVTAFERILDAEMDSLGQLAKSIKKSDFFKCLEWMSTADHIAIVGTMASASLARYFGYASSKVLPSVRSVTAVSDEDSNFIHKLGPDSLVFIIAFPRYPAKTIELGKLARKRGCRIVALTDSNQSPGIFFADIAFLISISATAVIDAYAAPVAFINGLVTEFAERYPEKVKPALTRFENYAADMQIWYRNKK